MANTNTTTFCILFSSIIILLSSTSSQCPLRLCGTAFLCPFRHAILCSWQTQIPPPSASSSPRSSSFFLVHLLSALCVSAVLLFFVLSVMPYCVHGKHKYHHLQHPLLLDHHPSF